MRHDYFHIRLHKFRRQRGQSLVFSFGGSPFDKKILSFDITQLAHSLHKCAVVIRIGGAWRRTHYEKTDAPKLG